MKEMERILLLKRLIQERERANKLTESFSEESKAIFDKAEKATNNPKDKVGLLDYIIENEYLCEHEYGLINPNDSFMDKECICLDCGEYLDKSQIKRLYGVNTNMLKIRKEYLELIQQMSVCDSVTTLALKHNFKRI